MSKLTEYFNQGQEYGCLTYLGPDEDYEKISPLGHIKRNPQGLFKCRCGNVVTKRLDTVKDGRTKACGCMKGKRNLR